MKWETVVYIAILWLASLGGAAGIVHMHDVDTMSPPVVTGEPNRKEHLPVNSQILLPSGYIYQKTGAKEWVRVDTPKLTKKTGY